MSFGSVAVWRRWCSGHRRARPPARLWPHFVRRRASKPGQAPPPPTNTAAWPLTRDQAIRARKDSPCSPPSAPTREIVRPAHAKHHKTGLFRLLGEFFRAYVARADSQHLPTTLPETDDTNAGGSLPRYETGDTSASSFPHTVETTDTFARTKRPIPGHFLPAKASWVSSTPRRAPAKAITVSRTAPQPPAKASPVSPSPDATPTAQTSRGVRTRHNAGGTLAT